MYTYHTGKLHKVKDGLTLSTLKEGGYFERHPDAIVCKGNIPSFTTLEKWDGEGYCHAIDGCKVEPDGTCAHGCPSWLLAMGMI